MIRNKSLNIGALLKKKNDKKAEEEFATVQVPAVLPRIIRLPDDGEGNVQVILLEQIIERNISELFLSYDVICAHPYRIMRNADLTIEEDEAEASVEDTIEENFGEPVVKTELPYDFFADDTSLEFVEEEKPEENEESNETEETNNNKAKE